MIKLARYLKPYLLSLFFAIALLVCQAICDLNLPNFMSNIVSTGIQQGGIDHAAPEAISANGYTLMRLFLPEEQKQLWEESYTKLSTSDTGNEHDKYVKKYPLLAQEDIYVRNDVNKETLAQLNQDFGIATWTFLKFSEDSAAQNGQTTEQAEGISDLDFSALYAMIPTLEQIPSSVMKTYQDQASGMQELMLNQSGIAMTRNFYQELGMDVNGIQTRYIINNGLIMLAIALCGGLATVLVTLIASRMAAGVSRDLRKDVFRKVSNFSNNEFDKFSTASLITRTTNDITQVQMVLLMGLRLMCYAPIMGGGGVIMALGKSVSMSWVIALSVVVLIGLIGVIFAIAMPRFKKMQSLIDRLNLVARENLNGLMVIRAFGTEKFEKDRYETANMNLAKNQLFVNRLMVVLMPAMMFIMNCTNILIVWVGAQQIANSSMQIGDMMAFMQYAMQIIIAFLMISMMFILVPRASVSANRIQEVLATESSVNDPEKTQPFDESKTGVVEFKDVCFRYHGADENVLDHITFTAKPGQTTAFIGSTGSGKSTLVNLIPRFYDATEGEVIVNGVNVKDVAQHDLRDVIGYVPQKGILFKGTIASNLRYGDENASLEELEAASAVAQAIDFISKKPEGFESPIAEGGSNVSGGQKQRLSIARALTKKPDIYIFDDSFSALDFKTDAALRHALKEYTSDSTVLIVAQRVGTIMNAEQIIVLDEGKVMGIGTHEELLKNCPTYYEIAASQLSKEELE
ncbi:MAG: ABC transporter ATP-binding protein [Clostridiales bacterium]|jgi:ATP-binding cassette subfamily B multidrug efflux pump|nr:ABC transporter ATP-binding protein [Clostridiales bacterium]